MEIGSEFNLRIENLVYQRDNPLKYFDDMNCVLFDSARSALSELYIALGRDAYVLLPEYLCESVLICFPKEKIIFYRLTNELQADLEDIKAKISDRISVIYIVNYFAIKLDHETTLFIKELRNKYNFIIIEDTTHSLFSKKLSIGDFAIASLRKWFPIPDGGILYTKDKLPNIDLSNIPHNVMISKFYGMVLKTLFLDGVLDCNSTYRKIFEDGEKSFSSTTRSLISNMSEYLLRCVSLSEMLSKRKANFVYLAKSLETIGIGCAFGGIDTNAPFVFPVLCNGRDTFREYLSMNKVYCAVHWPLSKGFALEDRGLPRYLSDRLLSLPVDQRYSEDEMQYMVNIIRNYRGNI